MNQTAATFLQIDLQNLFYGAKNKGQRLDFEKVWAHFHERETEFLTAAVVYLIRSVDFDSSKFEAKLKMVGYQIVTKNTDKVVRPYQSPYNKPVNHDIAIAVDCFDHITTFDKWVLMSGNGDFAPLCKYLREKGKKVEIWGFRENHDSILDPYVDRIHYIDESFFFHKPRVTVFGFNNLEDPQPPLEGHVD